MIHDELSVSAADEVQPAAQRTSEIAEAPPEEGLPVPRGSEAPFLETGTTMGQDSEAVDSKVNSPEFLNTSVQNEPPSQNSLLAEEVPGPLPGLVTVMNEESGIPASPKFDRYGACAPHTPEITELDIETPDIDPDQTSHFAVGISTPPRTDKANARRDEHTISSTLGVEPDEIVPTADFAPSADFAHLIQEAASLAQQQRENAMNQLEALHKEGSFWRDHLSRLHAAVAELIPAWQVTLNEARSVILEMEAVTSSDVVEKFRKRQANFELLNRMLQRVFDKLSQEILEVPEPLPSAGSATRNYADEVMTLASGINTLTDLELKTSTYLQRLRYDDAEMLGLAKKENNALSTKFLGIVTTKILPIQDGFQEGTKSLGNQGLPPEEGAGTNLISLVARWAGLYTGCDAALSTALHSLGIARMQDVEPGMPADYSRHEALGEEEDDSKPSESIKELLSHGYECIMFDGTKQVLRVARVVTVC